MRSPAIFKQGGLPGHIDPYAAPTRVDGYFPLKMPAPEELPGLLQLALAARPIRPAFCGPGSLALFVAESGPRIDVESSRRWSVASQDQQERPDEACSGESRREADSNLIRSVE